MFSKPFEFVNDKSLENITRVFAAHVLLWNRGNIFFAYTRRLSMHSATACVSGLIRTERLKSLIAVYIFWVGTATHFFKKVSTFMFFYSLV